MAIGVDAKSNSGTTSASVTNFTWSHTCASSAVLVVAVGGHQASSGGTPTSPTVTFNGAALTQVRLETSSSNLVWLGYLAAPTAGSHTISVTLSAAAGGASGNVWGAATSFTGVNTSSPIDSSGTGTTVSGTSISVNVTTVAANAWIVDAVTSLSNSSTPSPNSPQTTSFLSGTDVGSTMFAHSYNGPIVTPASTSDGWTGFTSTTLLLAAFSLKPGGTGHNTNQLMLLGCGT